MKFYVDLHLCPRLEDHAQTRMLIKKSAELGYKALGISFPLTIDQKEIEMVKGFCEDVGVDLVTRIDLKTRTSAEMLKNLRSLRRRFEVVAVQCHSKTIARQAAKDRRVDLLSFPFAGMGGCFFDNAAAELASKALSFLEIDMAPLLYLSGLQRSHFLTALRKEVSTARRFKVPIVLSSGVSDVSLLRKAEDYASLAYLFNLDLHEARQAFSDNPRVIIERNRRKLSRDYVAPGIYIVKRGKDCRVR